MSYYFRTSFDTLRLLATSLQTERTQPPSQRSWQYETLAGLLVLARHGNGEAHGDFQPYQLGSAGANAIEKKVQIGGPSARVVVERLKAANVIEMASECAKSAWPYARCHIRQGDLDLDLPHAFVDSRKTKDGTPVDSVLMRIRSQSALQAKAALAKPGGLKSGQLQIDMLTMLIALYRHTNMSMYGGLNPSFCHRPWDVITRDASTQFDGATRWEAEPQEVSSFPRRDYWAECLPHVDPADPAIQDRIENAWSNIRAAGLVYEAVSLYCSAPTHSSAAFQMSIRVNDYHAGSAKSATSSGDPALLRGDYRKLGYYTQPEGKTRESMWVVLPDAEGSLVGVWRPRFRMANGDTGGWRDADKAAVARCLEELEGCEEMSRT